MATSQLSEFIQHLRTTLLLNNGTGLTDGPGSDLDSRELVLPVTRTIITLSPLYVRN